MGINTCSRYICIEVSEDTETVVIKSVDSEDSIAIEVDRVEEVLEVLEDIADTAAMVAQYIRDILYLKGVQKFS